MVQSGLAVASFSAEGRSNRVRPNRLCQAYSVMIDKNVAVEVKMKAFQSGTTFSDVVNNALMHYLLIT